MSNYVNNMIICRKEIFYKYFLDNVAFGKDSSTLNISFNKLFNVKTVEDYYNKIGTTISYGWVFSYVSCEDKCVIKFLTRSFYPIEAIIQAIKLSHDLEWYAVNDNNIYLSKFYWDNEIKEDILYLGDDFDNWIKKHIDFDDSLFEENESDCGVWYFLRYSKHKWKNCDRLKDISIFNNYNAYVKYPFDSKL